MAGNTTDDRLQPWLLDRLTDDAPEEMNEPRAARATDLWQLREILRRDLAWLLDTSNSASRIDRDLYPHAFRSVMNYGVAPLPGGATTPRHVEAIRDALRDAVIQFEPRLRPDTLQVKLRDEETGGPMTVYFDISGDLWARPHPLELYLRAEIDLMTGHVRLEQEG